MCEEAHSHTQYTRTVRTVELIEFDAIVRFWLVSLPFSEAQQLLWHVSKLADCLLDARLMKRCLMLRSIGSNELGMRIDLNCRSSELSCEIVCSSVPSVHRIQSTN